MSDNDNPNPDAPLPDAPLSGNTLADAPAADMPPADNPLSLPEMNETPLPAIDAAAPLAPAEPDSAERKAADLEAVFDVPVQVSAILGRSRMEIGELLRLAPGMVLELDRKVGEAIDVYVNNRLVARGEVVLVEDKLGVTMTEIIQMD